MGRFVTVFSLKVTATSLRSVFSNGVSALTSITWLTSPTCNLMSTRVSWSTETPTVSNTAALKPAASTRT